MMEMELFKHQKEAADFIAQRRGSGAIFHEMGLGKTRTAIEIFRRLREKDPMLRMIVVAPLSLLEVAWADEVDKCALPCVILNLHKEGHPKPETHTNADIFTINYEALLHGAGKIFDYIRWTQKQGYVWMCILDESSKIKNYSSQITKLLLKKTDLFQHRIIMSGTPAPNSEMEYWPQMQFVAPGSLGTSMTVFRNHFFHLVNRYTGAAHTGVIASRAQAVEVFRKCDYKITEEKRKELMALIVPHCHVAKKKDCLDLPDQVDEVRMVEISGEQRRIYLDMKRHLVAEIRGQQIAAPLALTKILKLRQITSGFIYNETGESLNIINENRKTLEAWGEETNAPPDHEFENPKLKELFDVIEEAGPQPLMIWIQFHWELIKVCHELHEKFGKNQVVTLSALTKDKDDSIKAFQTGRARFLVAHPASAAHGLTFVNCSLQVFFSLDFSWEKYEQARARVHRAGQTKKCTYIHLIAKDTIDEGLLAALRRKAGAQEIVYDFIR